MSMSITKAFQRARHSTVCLCGVPKRRGYPLCVQCFVLISREQREGMRSDNESDRPTAFYEACRSLGYERQLLIETHPVFLTEEQIDALFLGASIEGKRMALAALLDWARIDNPRAVVVPDNPFNQAVQEMEPEQQETTQ